MEIFHIVLKSGCPATQFRIRSAERPTSLLSVLRVIGWRVFWLTLVNRTSRETPAEVTLSREEVEVLDRLAGDPTTTARPTADHYCVGLPQHGCDLACPRELPPRNMVLRRGLTRHMDVHLGVNLSGRVVGD